MLAHAVVQTVLDGPENRGREASASPSDAADLLGRNHAIRNHALPGRRIRDVEISRCS